MSDRTIFRTVQFSVIVVRNPQDGRWLAVHETRNRGWWLPAGAVDSGESFETAALRECKEEAGIDVELKGVLRVEHSLAGGDVARMRVIFYAEPAKVVKDSDDKQHENNHEYFVKTYGENLNPKQIADGESEEARWVTLDEFEDFPKKRGPELIQWGRYLESGGLVMPLNILTNETSPISKDVPFQVG